MNVKAEWLELSIKQYDDDSFEGYEALTDERIEGDSHKVLEWAIGILQELETNLFSRESLK